MKEELIEIYLLNLETCFLETSSLFFKLLPHPYPTPNPTPTLPHSFQTSRLNFALSDEIALKWSSP